MGVTRADVPHTGQSSHHSAQATGNGGVEGPVTHWPLLGRGKAGGWLGLCLQCSFCVAVPVLREEGRV